MSDYIIIGFLISTSFLCLIRVVIGIQKYQDRKIKRWIDYAVKNLIHEQRKHDLRGVMVPNSLSTILTTSDMKEKLEDIKPAYTPLHPGKRKAK